MDEAQRPTTPVQFDIDLHHYRQLIQNLPRLVPTSNHIGSFNKARYGVHDDTQFEKIYTYVAKGLDLAETRDVCFDLWVQNTSLEVIKKLLGEPWVLEEGGEEYQPPHAHRLRALALGLKIYGKLLSRASFPEEAAFVTDDKVNPHLLLSLPLADIWNRWWEPVLNSRFPLLRFSGFFGLRQAFFNPNFTRWFQGIAGSAWLLGSAVLDDSAYVRELCCQTISELVHHQGDPANTQAYSAIVEALVQLFQRRQEFREANHGIQLFVRMELIWVLANKSQAPFSPCHAEKFLQAAGLLEKFWEVWEFSERRARDQTSESIYRALGAFDGALILSSLFRRPLESACDLSATISSILNYAGEQVESLWPTEDGKLWALCLIPALTGLMENAKVGGVGFIIETLLEVHVQLLCQLVSEPSLRIQLENQVLLMWPSGAYLNKVCAPEAYVNH
ncbi:hypothetical protein L0F63_001343 [Massospora cicadina]|nr:hypothetical protein L0F63_001343 [Massospora cicadina]